MKLSRLHISGFKSFPDRSELSFDHGVTAIVGPNGCGKSNVVDAITWVLGEQSAKSLRGASMEDVIFAGSDARKPTAAAEVRLKLANVPVQAPELRAAHQAAVAGIDTGGGNGHGNGNGHHAAVAAIAAETALLDESPVIVRDVEIGRRLYRSGESEYLIDGEVCRLRDVHDLLMDSGLGVKAYAVIEQGKIGQILSSRPADRRQLIEEAAGVTKYKNRRRSAELKLEAAEQNLTRVDDIVFEVEKQRGALKRQAARARRYRALREELRKWEQVHYARRYTALAAEIEQTSSRLTDARAREAAASARLAEVEATAERIRIELAEAEARATTAREQAHVRELEIGRRQQQITFDRHQIETLQQAAGEISAELDALAERREPARIELDARRQAAERAELERRAAREELDALDQAYRAAYREIEGTESDVEAARSEVFSAMNAATALRHALDTAHAARERLSAELSRLDVERRDVESETGRAHEARTAAEADLARAREALDAIALDRAARESELTAWRGERDRQGADARAREHDLAGMTARLSSLEQLERQRAEYGDAARLLLADAGALRQAQGASSPSKGAGFSHRGSVADWLEVDDSAVRAVEALLGDLVEFIVVESQAQAEAGLRIAQERGAGRVGFLVLGDAASAAIDPPPAGVRPLADVIRTSDPAGASVVRALGSAWIADSLAAALDASSRTPAPVATWNGEVCRNGRLIQGGLRQDARGILETKREIRELRDRVAESRSALDRLREVLASLDTRIATSEAGAAVLTGEHHTREKSIVGLELQLTGAGEAIERLARRMSLIEAEHHRAEEERKALELREEEARASIMRIEGDQKVADSRLSEAQRRLFGVRESAEAHAREVAEGKAKEAALVERASALAADVQRLQEAGAELESRIAARQDDLGRNASRREELRAGIIESERLLDEDVRAFDALKDAVRTADDDSASLRMRFDAEEQEIRGARRVREDVRGEAMQLEVASAKAQADLQHLSDLCFETLASSITEVAAEVERLEAEGALVLPLRRQPKEAAAEGDADDEEGSESQEAPEAVEVAAAAEADTEPVQMTLDEVLSAFRKRIERLGPVNMMAIEQFDELETRHTFLTTQRQDLLDSIRTTNEAIKRIDKTTKERFREAFETINANFERTFATLFGGGRAGLTLLDLDEQSEAGIDIHAQPPGKRLQNVQLLSGGEKAMTAMALMFAIFRYRPSPFCLLDEIDAPLDDANIGRFVEMLQGMQDHTQFILITHNRKTMEIADRLYGVTMEEPGVSKLISVNLN